MMPPVWPYDCPEALAVLLSHSLNYINEKAFLHARETAQGNTATAVNNGDTYS